jgi:MOSC domain-containing protein
VNPSAAVPRVANIRLHPIKSLDPVSVKEARIGPGGGLEFDRAWALYSVDGQWVNGKRTPAIHLIRAAFAPGLSSVTLSVPGDTRKIPTKTFAFPGDAVAASQWFSHYFEQPITVRHSAEGFPDDSIAYGPTIVSTASLQAVCDLFNGIDLDSARQRFRTTLEIDGVPAFWEDQLFGEDERSVVRFRIGEVHFEGSNPCARCPVPPRDPRTGEIIPGFQKILSDYRRSHIPSWCPEARFDHYYRFSTNTRVAPRESGRILRVGDSLVLS